MERMVKNLPLSYIEISKENLVYNIKQFRRIVKEGTKIAAVIKANAYGHGIPQVVPVLNPFVDYFQVNSIEELEQVRMHTKKQVLLLGYVAQSDINRAIKYGCILSVFSLKYARIVNAYAQKYGIKQKIHVAIDAHLGREGLLPEDVEEFVLKIKELKYLVVDGVYAHFANIEDVHPDGLFEKKDTTSHAAVQIEAYEAVLELFKNASFKKLNTHISATSGVLAYEKWKGVHPLVRVGVGAYGMWPSVELQNMWQKKIKLLPVLRWVTHVAQVKTIPAGESIGYGLTYVTPKLLTIAVIPQGYSNGLVRLSSNNGDVLIRGKRAPILGRVAMNMFVVDVTGIAGVTQEDEVVIIGSQKGEMLSPEEIASKTQTINYEVTTRISPLLPRIIV